MKFYNHNTTFSFGIYEGKTLSEIAAIQPSYIWWCSINLAHFFIEKDVIEDLKEIHSGFSMSEEALEKLAEKYEIWDSEQDDYPDYDDTDDYDRPDYQDYERDSFDALTDGQYGSYDDWRENGGDFDSLKDGLGY
jgi:hypothetical protein